MIINYQKYHLDNIYITELMDKKNDSDKYSKIKSKNYKDFYNYKLFNC